MRTIGVKLSESDLRLLEARTTKDTNVATLCREIIGNWCADKRGAVRMAMAATHYTQRSADDYTEAE